MTEYFNQALKHIDRLTADQQAMIADAILTLASDQDEVEEIPEEHMASVLRGLAQSENGQFATEDEIEATFARFQR